MNLLKSAAIAASIVLLSACGGGGSPAANNNNNNNNNQQATTGTVTYWTANTVNVPMGVTIDGINIGTVTAIGNAGAATNLALRPPCGSNSTQAVSKVLTAGNHSEVITVNGVPSATTTLVVTANTCLRIQML
jgi:hypothetical protein